ncbi:MAG TPA: alkaline phosphatase family protein [Chloroflexota bacterium]|nr:alkaline phosphatase family protein [Chloroflexota bacterium]
MVSVSHGASRKVLVIGLDCVPPELVFSRPADELPNLHRLMSSGAWGEFESCTPPITVPAWTVMTSSHDPGQLGIYGFRNRSDYTYDRMYTVTNQAVHVDRVWDILSRAGKQVIVVGVPPSYPPRPVNGAMVGCFLTPSVDRPYTYPVSLGGEISGVVGKYLVDVPDFRTENKDYLLKQIYEMTEKRFKLVDHLLTTKPWDFFMFVEMGTDRIHHGFWRFTDPAHNKYVPGNPYENVITEYYKFVDQQIGKILEHVGDDTVVFVVSDHGAKRMDGGICLNEWLIQRGYLTLKEYPSRQTPIEKCEVDWSKTVAWGAGGYYGRLMLNVAGREPQGIVPADAYEQVRDELIAEITKIAGPDGQDIGTQVFKPQDIYREVRGIPPDLIIHFGGLYWRSVGTIGKGEVYTFDNDTGPDDANHAEHGIFIVNDPRQYLGGQHLSGVQLMDFAPTVLDCFGINAPPEMLGRVVGAAETNVYSEADEEIVTDRLRALGYVE